jgi:acyl carrier protein
MKPTPVQAAEVMIEEVVAWLRRALDDDDITGDDRFLEIGGHSMMAIELNTWVAERFDASVDLADLFRESVRDAIGAAAARSTRVPAAS